MSTERERHASLPSTSPEDNALFLDIMHEAPLFGHRKSRSLFGSVFYLIILVGYASLAVASPWIFHPIRDLIPQLLCSCNVLLLIVTGIFQQYLVYQVQKIRLQDGTHIIHKYNFRVATPFELKVYVGAKVSSTPKVSLWGINLPPSFRIAYSGGSDSDKLIKWIQLLNCTPVSGYYSFSQKLKHIVRLPFAATSYGTAAMLLVMVWRPHISFLTLPAILRTVMVIEAICAGSFMSLYIGYVHQYNSLNSQPDVLKSLYSPLQPSSSLEGLRYHDAGRLSDQQMALLQYQRENLHFLSEEILRLQECLSKYERTNDGSTPQVDLAHLLAARDQELRTVSAEMNQLQSELRLARSLIAERDSEIQKVRTTNNQYVEENERLRAILGEWSTRAAKLERALEAERMSNLELQKKIPTLRSHSQSSSEPTK